VVTAFLDTNVLIDVLNGSQRALKRYEKESDSGRRMVVSALVAHELMFGALISGRPDHHAQEARILLADLEIIDWTASDAFAAARLRMQLRASGEPIGSFDALIAGQAMNRGWTLVTANTREFARVDGLVLENWSL
jgi:tRNA(fMet)-specific endonuclease VapC